MTYRENLLEGYHYLGAIRNVVFENAINIAMSGELKDFNDTVDVGESYNVELKHLKGTNDINLNKFIELFEKVDEMMKSIIILNGITDEELKNHQENNS